MDWYFTRRRWEVLAPPTLRVLALGFRLQVTAFALGGDCPRDSKPENQIRFGFQASGFSFRIPPKATFHMVEYEDFESPKFWGARDEISITCATQVKYVTLDERGVLDLVDRWRGTRPTEIAE